MKNSKGKLKKICHGFFSCIFFILLIFPTAAYPYLKNILPTEIDGLIENRNLNDFEFSIQNFGVNFDNYYQDNFPFRNTLIPLYNKYYNLIYTKYFAKETGFIEDFDITNETFITELSFPEESTIIENTEINELVKDNTFISQETAQLPEQVPVRNNISAEETDRFKKLTNVLIETDNYFKSINKNIIFHICPRKHYIINRITSLNELDQYSIYIDQNTNVNFSYPKNNYFTIDPKYFVYDEYNGHHNFLGAYLAWQDVQKKAGITLTDINNIEITEFEIDIRRIITTPFDINCCYPYNQDLPAVRKTENIKSINYNIVYKQNINVETLHNTGCRWMEFKSDNKNNQTIFITGDSFLETQVQYAVKDFEYTLVSHLYNFDAGSKDIEYRERIKRYIKSADVIVIVIGENNIWSNNLEHNPGLEHRIKLLIELADDVYQHEIVY